MAYTGFTDARKRANKKYQEQLDSFSLRTTKEQGARIRDAAARAGLSVNAFILSCINEKLESSPSVHE